MKMEELLEELKAFKKDINGNWTQEQYNKFQEKFNKAYSEVTGVAGELRSRIAKMQEITVDVVEQMAKLDLHPQNLRIQEYTTKVDKLNKELEDNDKKTGQLITEIQYVDTSIYNIETVETIGSTNDIMNTTKYNALKKLKDKKKDLQDETKRIQDRSYEIMMSIQDNIIPEEGETKYIVERYQI